ncbi:tetratricopeptide repeat protein [Massilia pseudoviolaceinigra]|uniref:tetratricopeptide repeat protein n=1 Tax=Massilia pseudoviolaceinigra TaxID=3057165 RepID=UPI00279656AE|nr:tetratricopeptide repeat protein [Massilia sp. CCM 9206]MDQ1924455.1 tetratricopeptide repeat protein [Massilia sp. CCM 9206]
MKRTPWTLLLAGATLCAAAHAQQADRPAASAGNEAASAAVPETVAESVPQAAAEASPAPSDASADDNGAAAAAAAAQEEKLYLDAVRALSEGRPDEATGKLERLLEKNSLHAGAWLDLAISHCSLGNESEAERMFEQIETRFNPPPAIRELIAHYRKSGCKGAQVARRAMSFKLGRGYDSNVNQGSSNRFITVGSGDKLSQVELGPDSLPKGDHFNVLSGDFNQPLGSRGMLLIAQLRALRHSRVDSQDTSSGLLALEKPWSAGTWTGRATAAFGLVRLGGDLYQRQGQVLLRATPPVALGEATSWSLTAGYSGAEYPTRRYYDSHTLDLGSTVAWSAKRASVVLAAGVLADHGRDTRPGGDRAGWYGSANVFGALGDKAIGEVGVSRQSWRSDHAYSPGLIDTTRRQDTTQLRASLQVPVGTHSALQLELRRTWNRENIPLFRYDSHAVQFSWRTDNW